MDRTTFYRFLLAFSLLWTFGTNAYCACMGMVSSSSCLSAGQENASKEIDAVVIWTKDGKSMSILLDDSPKVSRIGTDIVVKSERVEVHYPLTDYLKFTFEQKQDGSNVEPVIQGNRIYIHFSANRADISNLTPNEIVSVYSVNGMMELSSKAGPDGRIFIPNLPSGIHILKANHTNIKFVIR